ncbi:MAG TPA: hypothetical protein VF120_12390 [Ktedonobacterales bacterium]
MEPNVWTRKVNLFLLCIPLVVFAGRIGLDNEFLLAVFAGLALIPLAGFTESAVEELAELLGPFGGGLLHTTFGNLAELLLAVSVLLTFPVGSGAEVVEGSIAGVIIRNSLLFLGLGTFLGCWKNGRMRFNAERAGEYTTIFALAVIGLSLPTLAYYINQASAAESTCPARIGDLELFCQLPLSTALAVVLLISYCAYVLFAVFRVRDRQRLGPAAPQLPAVFDPVAALAGQSDQQALFSEEREHAEEREEIEDEVEDPDSALHPKLARSRALRQARKAERIKRAREARAAQVSAQVAHQEHTRTVHESQHAIHEHASAHTEVGTEEGEEGESFFERAKPLRALVAVIILAAAVLGVFAMSETFAHGAEAFIASNASLEHFDFFFGLIVIPVVGGLVELYGTTGSARANRMELVMAVTAGATIQMILLMVPVLVIVGTVANRPLDLVFKPVEVIVFGATTFAFMLLSRDGESTILEGVQLVALWTLLAVTALFLPPA